MNAMIAAGSSYSPHALQFNSSDDVGAAQTEPAAAPTAPIPLDIYGDLDDKGGSLILKTQLSQVRQWTIFF